MFERSLVKQSRVYMVIDVADVKDFISNKITWNLSIRLRTYIRHKIGIRKSLFLNAVANRSLTMHVHCTEHRISASRPVDTDLDK